MEINTIRAMKGGTKWLEDAAFTPGPGGRLDDAVAILGPV